MPNADTSKPAAGNRATLKHHRWNDTVENGVLGGMTRIPDMKEVIAMATEAYGPRRNRHSVPILSNSALPASATVAVSRCDAMVARLPDTEDHSDIVTVAAPCGITFPTSNRRTARVARAQSHTTHEGNDASHQQLRKQVKLRECKHRKVSRATPSRRQAQKNRRNEGRWVKAFNSIFSGNSASNSSTSPHLRSSIPKCESLCLNQVSPDRAMSEETMPQI